MWPNYVDLEKSIYLEALKKHNVFAEEYKRVSFKKILNHIKKLKYQIKKDKKAQILLILTSSDLDKEYLYDSIKAEFQRQVILYIPMCPIYERILYHIYSCFIEDFGLKILENLNPNSSNLRKNDAISALREYQQDSVKKDLLRGWFLDNLTKEEEITLGISTNVRNDKNSLEIIKCICDSSEEAVLLFFEDIELINQKYGTRYGKEWGTKAEIVFLNVLYSFFIKARNVLIILPCNKTSWNELLKFSNVDLLSVLESNEIEFFDFEGLKRKIIKIMDFYWLQNRIRPPTNALFPLNEGLLERFFEKSHGNLKKFFVLCIKTIEEILDGERPPAEIE